MQTICTSLQTDNHANTSSLNVYRPDALPDAQPAVVGPLVTFNIAACWTVVEGTDVDLGAALESFFSTLLVRMFRLMNAQYALDDRYVACVVASARHLSPFGDVPQKLSVQLRRSLVAARTFYQGLAVGRHVVDRLIPVSCCCSCSSGGGSGCLLFIDKLSPRGGGEMICPRRWQFDGGVSFHRQSGHRGSKNRGGSTSVRGRVRSPHTSGGWRWLSCRQPACL